MKKLSRVLAIVLVLAMVLPGLAQAATLFAEEGVTRIAGDDRWETAVAASKDAYSSADTVIIVNGRDYADALTGTVLAQAKNAPLLLVDKKNDKIPAVVEAEIKRLGAEKAIIVGGEVAVSKKMATALEKLVEVERVAGENRYETALEVAKKAEVSKDLAFLVKGNEFADALAVGPVAAMKNAPIFLTKTDKLDDATKAALADYAKVVVVGGEAAVSKAVYNAAEADERVAGANRWATALEVAEKYFAGANEAYVANGRDFPDALVGGYLGAKNNAPVLLTDKDSIKADVVKYLDDKDVTVLGGTNAVGKKVVDAIVGEDSEELKVVSVSAINATQIEIKLSKAIEKADLFADSTALPVKTGVTISVTPIGGTTAETLSAATLSKDGKIITLNKATPFTIGRSVVLVEGIKVAGEKIVKYDEVLTIKEDTTAPIILSTKALGATSVEVTFSEPLLSEGTISYKYADGKDVTSGDVTHVLNGDKLVFTLQPGATVGKEIVATLTGAMDTNNNLLNPNPATVKMTKGSKDGVKPIVASVNQTGLKVITVKFSEELQSDPSFVIGGAAATKVVRDSSDKTKYEVTAAALLDGAKTVAITGIVDLSGEIGDDYSKVHNFKAEEVTAAVTSVKVYTDDSGDEQLEITFDNNVDLTTATVDIVGTRVKDNVTTTLSTTVASTPGYKDANNHKIIIVKLDDLLGTGVDDEKGAVYDTKLVFVGVASETGKAVKNNTFVAKFTRGEDVTLVTTVPALVSALQGSSNNEVVVKFNTNVDLATATVASNYVVGGAIVESATASAATTTDITLTLKANSNTFTGPRNVTVKNVKALNGTKAMETTTIASGVLKENVIPTFTATLVGTDVIKVDFSEPIAHTTFATALGAGNFTVEVNEVANTVTAVNEDNPIGGTATAVSGSTGYKTVYLVLSTTVTDTTKPITLAVTNIQDVTEIGTSAAAVGNLVSTAVVNVSK